MSSRISFFGDMLVDLVRDGDGFYPQAGGSVFNTAVAAAQNGYDVNFIANIGRDYWGEYLLNVCRSLNIDTQNISQSDNIKTSLAFAVIDRQGNASYDFYKEYEPYSVNPDILSGSSLFHFGSTFSVMAHNIGSLAKLIQFCRKNNIIVSYDPNCRPGSDADIAGQWCEAADIVKMSTEDADYLYPDMIYYDMAMHLLSSGVGMVVLTMGSHGAVAYTDKTAVYMPCSKTDKPIKNTIGAGDNFTAGMIDYIISHNITDLPDMSKEQVSQLCMAGNAAALKHITGS